MGSKKMKVVFSDGEGEYSWEVLKDLEPFLFSKEDDEIQLLRYKKETFVCLYEWFIRGKNIFVSKPWTLRHIQEVMFLAEFLGCNKILECVKFKYPFCLVIPNIKEQNLFAGKFGTYLNIYADGWITFNYRSPIPIAILYDEDEILIRKFDFRGNIDRKRQSYDRQYEFELFDAAYTEFWWSKFIKKEIKVEFELICDANRVVVTVSGLEISVILERVVTD